MNVSGPMFEPKAHGFYSSIYGQEGAHYNIYRVSDGMAALKDLFPEAKADEMNFVLFSTSGVHGTRTTIEEAEKEDFEITFLIVQPRLCCLRYGNCKAETKEDFEFLKKLRKTSWEAVQLIGKGAHHD